MNVLVRRLLTALRAPLDRAALVRAHARLVDEALIAQADGASRAEVARIVTGAHRPAVGAVDSAHQGPAVRVEAQRVDRPSGGGR